MFCLLHRICEESIFFVPHTSKKFFFFFKHTNPHGSWKFNLNTKFTDREEKSNPFPPNAAQVLLLLNPVQPVNSLAILLFFMFCWGQNMSNGQTALPETVKLCQTEKIKARHRYNHAACKSAGCTGESGPARSCTPPWHFKVGQRLIQSIQTRNLSNKFFIWHSQVVLGKWCLSTSRLKCWP